MRRFWLSHVLSVFVLGFRDELFLDFFFLYFFYEEAEGPLLLDEVGFLLVDCDDEEDDDEEEQELDAAVLLEVFLDGLEDVLLLLPRRLRHCLLEVPVLARVVFVGHWVRFFLGLVA